jgi:hypothetical protein
MKILITGCTAQQASTKTASRTPTFSALLAKAFQDGGADVSVVEPSVHLTIEELSEYDQVIVGIAPPTSLSANKVYPAFSIANKARKIGNLALFIDAPEPYKLQASLKSVSLNVADLTKEFYQRRKSYSHLVGNPEVKADVYEFNEFLYTQEWPTTYFPSFPWSNPLAVIQSIPNISSEKLVAVNLDAQILRAPYVEPQFHILKEYWTCDSVGTKWSLSVTATLKYDVISSRASRWEKESITLERIKKSVGTLVTVYRGNEPWWSPVLAQSLSVGVPVVTDWRSSSLIGQEWTHLASSIEEMTEDERFDLAVAQKESYLRAIPSWQETIDGLLQTIKVTV